ncbi:MAG: hypothetical protein AB7T38_01155 [Nitrospirales bacterium]
MKDSSSTSSGDTVFPTQAQLLHSLANKLLPIVVFSELALRQCQDEKVKQQLEKIHGAAGDARDIIMELKRQKSEATV